MVPVIFASHYLDYDFGPEHPFSPLRLAMLQEMLLELGAWQEPVPAQIASREEILSIHAERYVKRVEAVSRGEPVSDAQHYGLGTCIMRAIVDYPDKLREIGKIPDSKFIVIGIAIGKPDWEHPINSLTSEREPVENLLSFVD